MSGQTVAHATAMDTPPDVKRVLVIDDDPTILELIRHALGRIDRYEVVTAVNGADGLQSYFDAHPDCVIVDIGMPVMDGFELLQHCMRLPESHRPQRVIAISGEYEAGALRGQAVSFLPKPFDLNALLDMLGGKPN